MASSNVRNVTPFPSIPIRLTPKVAAGIEHYDPKRQNEHPLLRFQPTYTVSVPKAQYSAEQVKQLEAWWADLKIDLRDSPFVNDEAGVVIIWTFCGGDDADFENGVYGDDCE